MITNVSELRAQFNVTILDDDHRLMAVLAAAQKYAEKYCGTVLEAADVTEYHDGDGNQSVLLRNLPVNSIATVHDDIDRVYGAATLIPASDYTFDDNGILTLPLYVFTIGRNNIKVVYNAGFSDVPDDLKVAIGNIAFANYLEANGSINMVEGQDYVYRPKKLRDEAEKILNQYRKIV